MKTITCREAGFDCDAVLKGETEEDIMKRATEHAMKDHGMTEADMTPELRQKIRSYIKES